MPLLAAVKIAAAPGNRMGGVSSTQATNSSSRCRNLERWCSSNRHPVRQVSMRNATAHARRRGNQPPSISLVAFAATKIRSTARNSPFTASDDDQVVAPLQRDQGGEHGR